MHRLARIAASIGLALGLLMGTAGLANAATITTASVTGAMCAMSGGVSMADLTTNNTVCSSGDSTTNGQIINN